MSAHGIILARTACTRLLVLAVSLLLVAETLVAQSVVAACDPLVGPTPAAAATSPVFGFSVVGSAYRLEPWKNLLTEGGDRAVELGTGTEFIYLRQFRWNTSERYPYPDGTDPGEAWTTLDQLTLVERAKLPLFDRFLSRPEIGVIVMTVEAAGTDVACPTFSEQCQYFELTKYLMQHFNGMGKTFVLKNWEGDWLLLGSYCKDEKDPEEMPDPCLSHAGLTPAKNAIVAYKARRDGVAAARQQMAGQSDVKVYFAVEVNRVLDSLDGLLRLSNLLPYIGPDVVAYSAWDAVFASEPFNPADLTQTLNYLLDQDAQLAQTQAIGFEPDFAEFPVQPVDPLGLGNRRMVITEYSSREIERPASYATRISGVVDITRQWNLFGAYFWELYDNNDTCVGGNVPCGGGDWMYRPDGTRSLALDQLILSAGWTPRQVPAPLNLHTVPAVPVLGSNQNKLVWDRVGGGLSYLVTIYPPNSGATITANTVTRNWFTLGSSLPVGTYRWTVQARGATDSPVVSGPDFAITCQAPVAAGPNLPAGDTVWVEDGIPAGAVSAGTWIWDTSQKASGAQSSTEPAAAGIHQHYFFAAPQPLSIAAGDKLFAYVLLDPCNPPQEVMLQWMDPIEGWEHRAFWGQDLIAWGAAGTAARVSRGALPPVGVWTRLEVPAETLRLDGRSINGMAFTLHGGKAWFDRAGVVRSPVDGATFVSQTPPPGCMLPGSSANVSVTMQNSGTTVWASDYRLGSQTPQDNQTWGLGRVYLAPGESVGPGQSKTFSFTVTAPVAAGTYAFQWRMVHEMVRWFGNLTPTVTVTNTVPGVPTDLTPASTTFPATTNSVTLAWAATPRATSYAVRLRDDTDGTLRGPNNCPGNPAIYICLDGISSTSYSATVVPGHSYTWWVHAGDCIGYGSQATASFSVAAPGPPPAPSGLAPNATTVSATSSVRLQWSPTPGASRYAVRLRDDTDGTLRGPNNCPGNPAIYICLDDITSAAYMAAVVPGHAYTWWVHAGNSSGFGSPTNASFSVAVEPLHPPANLAKEASPSRNLVWTPPDNKTDADAVTYDLRIYGGTNCASGCLYHPGAPSWYTMGSAITPGQYTWTLKAMSASRPSSPAVSGPPFTMP